MRKFIMILILAFFLVACVEERSVLQRTEQIQKIHKGVKTMKLVSNNFKEGETIPRKFTCQGEDINPNLTWEDIPEGTKSFALIVDDPDAPMGTWIHWLVHSIPKETREIQQNSVPGKQVTNDFGKEDYGGPCPPSGTHRYFFRLYALDVETLQGVNKDNFREKVEEHAIAKAELMCVYKKT